MYQVKVLKNERTRGAYKDDVTVLTLDTSLTLPDMHDWVKAKFPEYFKKEELPHSLCYHYTLVRAGTGYELRLVVPFCD